MKQNDYDAVAELYDLYAAADYDFTFFLSEISKVDGPVLELMAGTGRLSIPLVEAGAKLTCVDGSEGMLGVLRRKLESRDLSADVRAMDVRRLDFSTRFDLVILPFQSFMELVREEDQRAALGAVHRCLAPGGRFIATIHNPVVRRTQVDGVERLVGRFSAGDDTLVVSGFERGGDPVVERLQFFELYGADGILKWKRLQHQRFTLIEPDDLQAMAREAGFRIAELYGDYTRSPFDAEKSPVLIALLETDGPSP